MALSRFALVPPFTTRRRVPPTRGYLASLEGLRFAVTLYRIVRRHYQDVRRVGFGTHYGETMLYTKFCNMCNVILCVYRNFSPEPHT